MPADYDEDVEVLLRVRKIMADEVGSRTIDPTARDPKDPRLLAPLRHPVSDAVEEAKKIEKDQEAYINNKVHEYQAMGMDPRYKTRAKDRLAKVEIGDRNEDTRSLKDKLKGDYKNAKKAEKEAAEKAEKDRIEEAKHNAAAARAKVDADKAAKAAAKAATEAAEAQAKAAAAHAKATEANNKATAMKMQRSNERE